MTKEQLNILSSFKEDVFCSLTFKQIKERSRQRSNNLVQIALDTFQRSNLIRSKKIGNVFTYKLNLDNNLTLAYLNLINQLFLEKSKLPHDILAKIQGKVQKKTEFFILLIFGSYAKKKATRQSDLDIAIITDTDKKELVPSLESIRRRELLNIDSHIFTRKDFLQMLEQEMENVGKQIYKNSIPYYGYIEYVQMIKNERQIKIIPSKG